MSDAIPMVVACLEGQTRQYYAGRCDRCAAPSNNGAALQVGMWGLCALCAIRAELGLQAAPESPWWTCVD